MTLTNRVTRLFKADMHGLLDRLEEPVVVLKQAVRDMEDEVSEREARISELKAHAARAAQRSEQLTQEAQDLDQKLDLCLGSGKEDLARGVVRKKLESDRLKQGFLVRKSDAEAKMERAERELAECRERLADVKRRMELFVDESSAANSDDREMSRSSAVSDDDVEIALLKEREKRSGKSPSPRKGGDL